MGALALLASLDRRVKTGAAIAIALVPLLEIAIQAEHWVLAGPGLIGLWLAGKIDARASCWLIVPLACLPTLAAFVLLLLRVLPLTH
jgi:hypothetical protein